MQEPIYDQAFVGNGYADEGKKYPVSLGDFMTNNAAAHFVQVHPHFGLHAGMPDWTGYGWAHVHPGTSWTWLHETEGLGATLDQFLEMVSTRASSKYT